MGKNDRRRSRNRRYIKRLKQHSSCVRCGDEQHEDLTFHHRDPSTKEFNISKAPRLKVSIERLEREIAKCDVLCPDCHRLEHEELVLPPTELRRWMSDFVSQTLTSDGICVIITSETLGWRFVGTHATSRRLAHDDAWGHGEPYK